MASVADNFNRADGAIGANWTQDAGTWLVASNTARQSVAGASYFKARYTATPPDTNNVDVQAVVRSNNGTLGAGVGARLANSSTVSGYALIGFGGDFFYLISLAAGAETILDVGPAMTAGVSYTVRLVVNGITIEGYINGVLQLSVTDATYASGGWGLISFGVINTANDFFDDWQAADLAVPSKAQAARLVRSPRPLPYYD